MPKHVKTSIPPNLICSDGPYHPTYTAQPGGFVRVRAWEPLHSKQDRRPTFEDAINAYCAARGITIYRLCKTAGINPSDVYAICRVAQCVKAPLRARLATLIGMSPDAVRWPIVIEEARP